MIEFTIRYYRDKGWARRFARAGVVKPEGMVTSPIMYRNETAARETADHINALGPEQPCEVVRLVVP